MTSPSTAGAQGGYRLSQPHGYAANGPTAAAQLRELAEFLDDNDGYLPIVVTFSHDDDGIPTQAVLWGEEWP